MPAEQLDPISKLAQVRAGVFPAGSKTAPPLSQVHDSEEVLERAEELGYCMACVRPASFFFSPSSPARARVA